MRNMQSSRSREIKEFEEKVVQINRVSKKTEGGNKIGFSVLVVVGDKKGRVGVGLGKAPDVSSAIAKGVSYAKKHLLTRQKLLTALAYLRRSLLRYHALNTNLETQLKMQSIYLNMCSILMMDSSMMQQENGKELKELQ